jgi:3-phenylpropionate/cinnamic acid dioxygenase small subunit
MSILGEGLSVVDERRIEHFYIREASLLAQRRYREWSELLASDITYQVPVRANRPLDQGPDHSVASFHMDETRRTIEMRIERFEGPAAWAENPASRMRYFIANLRATANGLPGTFGVISDLLFTRLHGSNPSYEVLTGERHDVLVDVDGELLLSERLVLLDNVTLPTHNLAFFL